VDVGQTVQASYQSPTLFIVAADLTKMKCTANIDESDVGKIRPGQNVRFRIDAYPNDTFTGKVIQVRLQPIVVQNVVTYGTVIEVPNPDLKLKPGMTANVQIEISKKTDVVRIPNTAIRFRPSAEIFEAFNQPLPPELQPRTGAGGRRGDMAGGQTTSSTGATAQPQAQAQNAPAGAGATTPSAQPQAPSTNARASERGGGDRAQGGAAPGGFNRRPGDGSQGSQSARGEGGQGTGGGRRGFDPNDPEARARMVERFQQMPADQRTQWAARMKERGIDIDALVKQGAKPAIGAQAAGPRGTPVGATTIDALFGPLPARISTGRAWLWLSGEKKLKAVRLRLGITDGQYTELLEGELQAGVELVTGVTLESTSRNASQTGNPLLQQQQRGGMPGGMPGGGGGRGR
jgi:hypothetical protein